MSSGPTVHLSPTEALTASSNIILFPPGKTCDKCFKVAADHPTVINLRDREGKPYLKRLCTGQFFRF